MQKKKHRNERSFGVVPLRKRDGAWELFLVQHRAGHWSLPKGHEEKGEIPLQTAKRELFEETHFTIEQLLFPEPLFEHYTFTHDNVLIHKTVGYFIAQVTGEEKLELDELKASKWVPLKDASSIVTFREMKAILSKVSTLIGDVS